MTEIGAWRLLGVPSSGAFGSVFKAESLQHSGGEPFAFKLAHRRMDPRLQREAELLRRVRHRVIAGERSRAYLTFHPCAPGVL